MSDIRRARLAAALTDLENRKHQCFGQFKRRLWYGPVAYCAIGSLDQSAKDQGRPEYVTNRDWFGIADFAVPTNGSEHERLRYGSCVNLMALNDDARLPLREIAARMRSAHLPNQPHTLHQSVNDNHDARLGHDQHVADRS